MPAADQDLLQLTNGYRVSQAVYVVATLRIPDHLAKGPLSSDHLAALTGSHPKTLYRVLRALAAVGVFHEDQHKCFALTALGEGLQTDIPGSRAAWARLTARPPVWQAWGDLLETARSGESAFRRVHGSDIWQYRAANPQESSIFDLAMREGSTRVASAILRTYDFGRFQKIVDVAGGDGALLGHILAHYPSARGTLFDQPHVLTVAAEVLRGSNVADRCEIVAGSFFESVPSGGDVYLLKFILHDWEDEPAAAILRTCRAAMEKGARLLVIERLLGPPNEGRDGKFSDLHMLVNVAGYERSRDEFEALLACAGFSLTSVTSVTDELSILEAS